MLLSRWYKSSLRYQIVVWIVAINALAIILMFSGAMRIASNAVEKNISDQLEREHVIEAERIESYFSRLIVELEYFVKSQVLTARLTSAQSASPNPLELALKNYPLIQQDYDYFYILDKNQRRLYAVGGETGWLEDSLALNRAALNQNRMVAQVMRGENGFSLQIAYPLEGQGVLLVSKPIDRLVGRFFQGRRDIDAWALEDREGQVISALTVNVSADRSLIKELFGTEQSDRAAKVPGMSAPWKSIKGALRLPPPLSDLGLQLVLNDRTNWSGQVLREIAIPFLIMASFVATLVLLIVALFGKKLTTPLEQLTAYTLAISESAQSIGYDKTPLQALMQRSDEVGRLSTQFSDLVDRLRVRYMGLERRVAERNAQLEAIFQLSPDGFMEVDQAGRISFINPAFENLLGFSALETVGQSLLQWLVKLQAHTKDRSLPQLQTVFSVSNDLRILELVSPLKRTLSVLSKANQGSGMVVYVRDITQEAELQELRSTFMSTAAHELRTPISSILGYAQLLMRRLKTDTANPSKGLDEIASVIERQSKNMADLVNDLLDLTRFEHQMARGFHLQETSLVSYLRTTVNQFHQESDPRHLVSHIDDHLPPVRLHPESFKRVLVNLLGNAFKYSPPGSPVTVRTFVDESTEQAFVGIAIEDHGRGIAPEDLEHVFERFYRSPTHADTQGTGLGLAIVKEVMQAHGGEVKIRSTVGQGTTVTLLFPILLRPKRTA